MTTHARAPQWLLATAILTAAASCRRQDSPTPQADDTGVVRLNIVEVPTDVGCLQLIAAGPNRTAKKRLPLPPGTAQFAVAITGLPVGMVTFTAVASPGACSDADAPATWVSDAVTLTLEPGVSAPLSMTLHRDGQVTAAIGFDDGTGGTEDCHIEGDHLVCSCAGDCGPSAGGGDIDDYLGSFPPGDVPVPRMETIMPGGNQTIEDPTGPKACAIETRTVTESFEEVALLTAANSNIAPGVAIQSKSVADGTINLLPVARAGLTYVVDLPIDQPSITVAQVTLASAQDAVATLQRRAGALSVPAQLSFTSDVVSSFEQVANSLRVGMQFSSGLTKAGLTIGSGQSQSLTRRTVVARLIQPMYTVSVADDLVRRASGFLAPTVTLNDLKALQRDGALGPDNLPTFIKSVTYGRVLYLAVTTDDAQTHHELTTAMNAAFAGFEGSLELKDTYDRVLSRAQVSVLALGGSQDDALEAIRSGDYSLFFRPAKVSDAVPISYKLNYMHRDRGVVAIRSALTFTVRDCTVCTRAKEIELGDAFSNVHFDEAGGFFGNAFDRLIGGACTQGWQRHDIVKNQNGSGVCDASFRTDDANDCTVLVHIGVPAFNGLRCDVLIRQHREVPGQPPLCPQ